MTPPSIRYFMEHKARHKTKAKHKLQTTKIMDRLTYSPKKHKQRKVREMRERLQRKAPLPASKPLPPPTKLKFGSFNVNGLDLEACWAVQELLDKRGFDVSCILLKHNILIKFNILDSCHLRNFWPGRPTLCDRTSSRFQYLED